MPASLVRQHGTPKGFQKIASRLVQVARRVRSTDHIARVSGKGGKKRAVRYQCACLDEDVYLHPQSSLYAASPEFVIYTQLIRSTKRPYMTG